MSQPTSSREVRLVSRPVGEPLPENFALVTTTIPEPGEGEIVVRNTWMSVDPYMRGRMDDAPSYIPPFPLGAALEGSAIGEVIASRAPSVPVGAAVTHFLGRREYAVLDASAATVVDTTPAPPAAHLGPLGTTGLTAYAALTRTAPVREGDVVLVSAAAGAVGSVAGQPARKLGASRVIGSAGGPDRTRKLPDVFGYDAAEATLRGMLVSSHFDLFPEWTGKAAGRPADGSLRTEQTVVDGIEQAPAAFLGMMRGADTGKMLVRLGDH
ncbi:NADP-dependent oxidoreductase [Streptomyces sp. NPDC090022]|uniref:NADP-dependent oxidoreductase n=1 Tax=Streptomyces sp. NPDC090022 TaxID=3365920 RepID=UPI00382517DC